MLSTWCPRDFIMDFLNQNVRSCVRIWWSYTTSLTSSCCRFFNLSTLTVMMKENATLWHWHVRTIPLPLALLFFLSWGSIFYIFLHFERNVQYRLSNNWNMKSFSLFSFKISSCVFLILYQVHCYHCFGIQSGVKASSVFRIFKELQASKELYTKCYYSFIWCSTVTSDVAPFSCFHGIQFCCLVSDQHKSVTISRVCTNTETHNIACKLYPKLMYWVCWICECWSSGHWSPLGTNQRSFVCSWGEKQSTHTILNGEYPTPLSNLYFFFYL